MIGRTIAGRYRVTAKLGHGGMGTVWRADDAVLGRQVALKFLPEDLARNSAAKDRLMREARLASQLDHPNIATVLDVGEADGQPYIALQCIEGETLRQRSSRERLSILECLRICVAVSEALQHAHEHGILHRDISPRNIMLARDGRIFVLDFGLAQPEGQSRSGSLLGTIAFTAPEVIRGERATRSSDFYSLGVVLYEMLTGSLPFAGERPEALMYAAVHSDAVPPSQFRREVSQRLDRIVAKVIAKAPADRHQTAGELIAALREMDNGAPRTRRRVLMVVAALLSVAAVALLARTFSRPAPTEPLVSIAVLPFRDRSEIPDEGLALADGIAEHLVTKLGRSSELSTSPWMTSRRYSHLTRSFAEIAAELGVQTLVVGALRATRTQLSLEISTVDGKTGFREWTHTIDGRRSDLFSVQDEAASKIAAALGVALDAGRVEPSRQPKRRSVDAFEMYLRGQVALQQDDARAHELATDMFRKALELDPRLAEAYVGLGAMTTARYYRSWGGGMDDLEEAERNFRTALQLDPTSAAARRGLIRLYFNLGRDEECLKLGAEVREMGLEDVDNLLVRADAYHYGALFEKATPLYERVLEIDPANEAAHAYLVINPLFLGKHTDVVRWGERYQARFQGSAEVLSFMLRAQLALGNLEASAELSKRLAMGGADPWSPVLVDFHREAGETEQAATLLRLLTERRERILALYPDNHYLRAELANEYAVAGDVANLRQQESVLLAQNPTANSLAILARAHVEIGNWDRAWQLALEAVRRGHLYQLGDHVALEKLYDGDSQHPVYRQFLQEKRALLDKWNARY